MESEQLETEGKASKWEQALQRLEITPEQRLVIENAKAKEADDWSLEEADLIMRVSREARRLQAVDEYKALPQDDREREHHRVWQLIGGYTAFIAAACLAVISSSKSEGSYAFAFSFWVISLPFLCGAMLLDYHVRVRQARLNSKVRSFLLAVGVLSSHSGTVGMVSTYSWVAAVVYGLCPLLVGLYLHETIALGGRKNFEDL